MKQEALSKAIDQMWLEFGDYNSAFLSYDQTVHFLGKFFKASFINIKDVSLDEIVKVIDTNKDGKISKQEMNNFFLNRD